MPLNTLKDTREISNSVVEDAKPEDVEQIIIIARDSWLDIYPNEKYGITREDIADIDWFNPDELEKRRRKIREKGDNIHTWVIRDEKNNIVGFCKVSKNRHKEDTGGQREIDAMFVVKEFQKNGLGKKLIEKSVEWLGSDGDIRLEVVSYNTNAINFYKKFGFKETVLPVNEKRNQLPSGKQIPRIVMVRLH